MNHLFEELDSFKKLLGENHFDKGHLHSHMLLHGSYLLPLYKTYILHGTLVQ